MNGGKPVLSKKRQPDGYAERCKLLARHGFPCPVDRLSGAARDDILDAIAVCRTALLITAGQGDAPRSRQGPRQPRPADEHLVLMTGRSRRSKAVIAERSEGLWPAS